MEWICFWSLLLVIQQKEIRSYVHARFTEGYKTWVNHGEPSSSFFTNSRQSERVEVANSTEEDDISGLLEDVAGGLDIMGDLEMDQEQQGQQNEDMDAFYKMVEDAGQELYPGCKYSKLRFIIRLLHIKFVGRWSNKSFDMLLELLKDVLCEGSSLPKNFNAAKNIVKGVGLGYTKIHACENDCILFWKEHAKENVCPICKTSRWKSEKSSPKGKRVHRVPKKVLRYFPIKKRLQRYFMCSKTASDTRWHDEGRTNDGLLRHPADAPFWKDFDSKYPEFASESRNLRLAVASDGFNPFRTMKSTYSIWPVILIPYNLPPWKCMKQQNFILSLLIPGPKAPCGDMDVYLEPLVDDMKDMFVDGVRTYDASKSEFFQLRAAIVCTISDFPGLGYLVACVTSGKVACPECHLDTCSVQLKKGGKCVYMGHRRFLDANHKYRFDAESFDGSTELRPAPKPLSGQEILDLTSNICTTFGKDLVTKKPAKRPCNPTAGEPSKRACKKGDEPPTFKRWWHRKEFTAPRYLSYEVLHVFWAGNLLWNMQTTVPSCPEGHNLLSSKLEFKLLLAILCSRLGFNLLLA